MLFLHLRAADITFRMAMIYAKSKCAQTDRLISMSCCRWPWVRLAKHAANFWLWLWQYACSFGCSHNNNSHDTTAILIGAINYTRLTLTVSVLLWSHRAAPHLPSHHYAPLLLFFFSSCMRLAVRTSSHVSMTK